MCVCVCVCHYCLLGDIAMVEYYILKVLLVEMYVSVAFVTSRLYSALSLTPVRAWRFIRTVCYY